MLRIALVQRDVEFCHRVHIPSQVWLLDAPHEMLRTNDQ